MGLATKLAQRHLKTGSYAPSYRLTIGGKPFSAKLYDGSASYSSDGTSEFSINADADLEGLEGQKVVLTVGYGEERWPYFGGWLEEPEDDHWGGPATALSYGPFRELGEIKVGADLSYAGYTLGGAIADLYRRAGGAVSGSTYEIRGNPSYVLSGEEAGISLSTSFADGIASLLELAGWVSVDRPPAPNGQFRRRYRARPRPYPSAGAVATYTEAHYNPGGFKARRAKFYGSVGAYKRAENGELAWGKPVVVAVDPSLRRKAPLLKTYWLEDYAGTEADAWAECAELARMISGGVYSFSLSGISANPELELYETIRAHITELRDEGGRFKERYACSYACAIDLEAAIDVSREGMPMNVFGETAIRLSQKKLAKPFFVKSGTSAVVRTS